MYRFLATPRWLGYAALTLAAAAAMVGLGGWQLDRFHQRSAINARIDAGSHAEPTTLAAVLAHPDGPAGTAGPAPPAEALWRRVSLSGVYDQEHEILVRGRTVSGRVGFEVLTPLRLADGTAVLIDRGWIAPAAAGAAAMPEVPPPPPGTVTVLGLIRPAESRAGVPRPIRGHLETRRIDPAAIAPALPYPVYGAYVGLDDPADPRLTAVPPEKANALQNGGYVLQWWLFAVLTVVGFGYLAHKQAHPTTDAGVFDDTDSDTDSDSDSDTDTDTGAALAAGPG